MGWKPITVNDAVLVPYSTHSTDEYEIKRVVALTEDGQQVVCENFVMGKYKTGHFIRCGRYIRDWRFLWLRITFVPEKTQKLLRELVGIDRSRFGPLEFCECEP